MRVFNLAETSSYDLSVPQNGGDDFFINTMSSTNRISSSRIENGIQHSEVMDSDGNIVLIPVTGYVEDFSSLPSEVRSRFGHSLLSLAPGSSFASHFGNAMLLPSSSGNPHSRFRLLAGLTDPPETHCYDGFIGYASLPSDALRFSGRISIMAPPGQSLVTRVATQTDYTRNEFGIARQGESDMIPTEVFDDWYSEVMAIAQVEEKEALDSMDWSGYIHLLPSIKYSVLGSDSSSEVVAEIVLEPIDFIQLLPLGANVKLSPTTHTPTIGLNTLKHVGVFIDYEQSRIGFCEPI